MGLEVNQVAATETGIDMVLGDDDIAGWLTTHADEVGARLRRRGALLFRGFAVAEVDDFERVVGTVCPDDLSFSEESSPRSRVSDRVATSTDYPARYPIQFHNENSYAYEWPLKLLFCCLQPAANGGETVLADSRRVLSRLRPETADLFAERRILYARNYAPNLGVPWPKAFGTSDRAEVDEYCRSAGIETIWSDDRLQTRQVGDAIVVHPHTGERVWFNHALLFNVLGLEPDWLREFMAREPESARSSNSYFGDGEPIADALLEEIRDAYRAEAFSVEWQRGDVLVIDNMLCAHGRAPYAGDRRVIVAMGERVRREEVVSWRPTSVAPS